MCESAVRCKTMCTVRCVVSLLLLVCCWISVVSAFNVDVENFVRHRGDPGSMFGFSVAEHKEQGVSWLLIGAPEAQTPQPGVRKGGAVYRCDIHRDDACQQVPFDRTGNNNNSEAQIDSKSEQWFGATVRSSGEDGVILACAPRYVWYSAHVNRRDPVGTCYVARNQFSDFSEYSPCRTRNWGYHRQGSCQAGLGADVSRDGKRLYVGAVGSWYWQGQLHSIDSQARLLFLPPRRYTVLDEGQVISQNLHNRPDVISTNEGPATDDDSYLGYSVAAGDFSGGGGGQNDVAVGMPRGAGLLGKIVIYTWNTTNLQNITGEQLGAYFGYSLAAVDMDGDKLDDLVIGAPMYTESNNEGDYETGRIYVVYQGAGSLKFHSSHIRDGVKSKSRFGLALASLSDINRDGYGDVAVGAPYDGPNERGFVYIYHGSANGIREKPSQIITAEEMYLPITTFGFSLGGGLDLDGNQYPDLVVGAYESDTAVFLRARPVVKMIASVAFSAEQKQVILEEKNCTLKDFTRVTCLSLSACLEYQGLGVDDRLDFDVQLLLDSKKPKSPRMFFLSDEGRNLMNQSLRLDKGSPVCKNMFVYIKPSIRDKLTSLEAEMRYSLRGSNFQQTASTRRRLPRSLTPVLDLNELLVRKDSVTIQKNCGKDNICIPDIKLSVTPSVKRYLLGSGERLFFEVIIQNEGEDAFEAVFDLMVPPGINYVNFERIDTEREILVQCSAPTFINNNTLRCDIGNPLPKEKMVHFKVILQPFHKDGMKAKYEFWMSANSTNPENKNTTEDNKEYLPVPIWVETDLILQGSSHPSDVHYNNTLYTSENITQESEIGPQVVHIYSIRNKGPSDIVEAEAHFLWPSYTLADEHLLYLLEQPETSGPIKCEFVEEANAERLYLDRKRKSYLESGGTGIQSGLTSTSSSSGSGITVEEKHKSSSSISGSRSRGGLKPSTAKYPLTAEERRRLEEVAREKDEEEARAETGDGSTRHSTRIKEVHYRTQTNGEMGTNMRQGGQSNTNVNYEQNSYNRNKVTTGVPIVDRSKSESAHGMKVENESYFGKGSGTTLTERGRVETSGSFPSHGNRPESERRYEDTYRQTGSGTRHFEFGSNVEPGIGIGGTRNRVYESNKNYETSHSRGHGGVTDDRFRTQMYNANADADRNLNTGGRNESHFYSREENRYSNTSWNSEDGGKPRTYSTSNWTTNEDGVVRSGESQNVHETNAGKSDAQFYNETLARAGVNLNTGKFGHGNNTHVVSGIEHHYRNTSWSSKDGIPVTFTYSNWTRNEDGVTKNGSTSDTHEGSHNLNVDNVNFETSRSYGVGHSESGRTDSRSGYGNYGSSHSYDSSGQVDSRHGYGTHSSASETPVIGNVNSEGSASSSSQFGGLGAIAQGPRDGVARTYTFDVKGDSSSDNTRHHHASGDNDRASSSSQFDNLGTIAAGTRDGGARTYSFDVVGNTNAGDNTRHSESSAGGAGHHYSSGGHHYSSGGAETGGGYYENKSESHRSGTSSSSSGGAKHYSSSNWDNTEQDNDDEYDNVGQDNVDYDNVDRSGYSSSTRWSSYAGDNRNRGGSNSYVSSTYGDRDHDTQGHSRTRTEYQYSQTDNVVDEPGKQLKIYPRYKRQVDNGQESLDKSLQCGPTKCTRIKCTVGPLTKDQEAWIAFRSRVWVQTLRKFAYNPVVQLTSIVGGKVTKLPHIGTPDQTSVHTYEVTTKVLPRETGVKPEVVPLWVVVLSACAGAIILMLLVYLLYKCGFFKRNRPSNVPEKEPLNARNGHYQSGDEAL